MQTGMNKQYLMLAGMPVLAHTISAFEKAEIISDIIIVIQKEDHRLFEERILPFGFRKLSDVIDGGGDRQASVYQGLLKVRPDTDIITVHDGARPLITPDIIEQSSMIAMEKGAACVGVPVKDTIKKVSPEKIVEDTPERSSLWAIQTPQAFKRETLMEAHNKALAEGFRGTDDSVLVERIGVPVHMVMGNYTNIKITTREDIVYAEALLQSAVYLLKKP